MRDARLERERSEYARALVSANNYLAICADGKASDDLRRLRDAAIGEVVREGKACLRQMNGNCLRRVADVLDNVKSNADASAFLSELDSAIAPRIARELAETRACVAKGDTECADKTMRFALLLRGQEPAVAALAAHLDKAKQAESQTRSCLQGEDTTCTASSLEAIRSVSPRSPLIQELLSWQALRGVTPPPPSAVEDAGFGVPDIRVGDRWVMRSANGAVSIRTVTEVAARTMIVETGTPRTSNRRAITFTREWNVVAEREADGNGSYYAPPLRYFQFPLKKGTTWSSETRKRRLDSESELVYRLEGEVLDVQQVAVPAGTFEAIEVVVKIEVLEKDMVISKSIDTSWFSPAAKRTIKTETVTTDANGNTSASLIELVSFAVTP